MAEIFFISDTHFFHENILRFTDEEGKPIRPFSSISEMHDTIVKNWNNTVSKTDHVYHLGDVTFDYSQKFIDLLYSLNGHKRLCIGNHDKLHWASPLLKYFDKVMYWRHFKEHSILTSSNQFRIKVLRLLSKPITMWADYLKKCS